VVIDGIPAPRRLRGIMGAVDFTPSTNDFVIINGIKMSVGTVEPTMPDGVPILYNLVFEGPDDGKLL